MAPADPHEEILRRINRLENFVFFGGAASLLLQVLIALVRKG